MSAPSAADRTAEVLTTSEGSPNERNASVCAGECNRPSRGYPYRMRGCPQTGNGRRHGTAETFPAAARAMESALDLIDRLVQISPTRPNRQTGNNMITEREDVR